MGKSYTGDWYNLYGGRWNKDIVPDAYAHPAKYARDLIRHIYAHLFVNNYLRSGDSILDPFAGVALGALDALLLGCHWTGMELEPRFVGWGQQNIDFWNETYQPIRPDTWGTAMIIQGDSRNLASSLREVDGLISSPPYLDAMAHPSLGSVGKDEWGATGKDIVARRGLSAEYGEAVGQLGSMHVSEEGLQAVITSPPYAESFRGQSDIQDRDTREKRAGGKLGGGQINHDRNYGDSIGQLAAMAEGNIDSVVSSPPYRTGGHHNGVFDTWGGEIGETDTPAWSRLAKKDAGYGQEHGQMEQMGKEDDFWTAARTIVDQCCLVLRPRGVAVWVVKRFVRDKQVVDFPDQWRRMCEAAGLETIEWIRAWFVEDKGTQIDLWGNHHQRSIERKSFFRRLYESKYPENSIDWEDVLIMRKGDTA